MRISQHDYLPDKMVTLDVHLNNSNIFFCQFIQPVHNLVDEVIGTVDAIGQLVVGWVVFAVDVDQVAEVMDSTN